MDFGEQRWLKIVYPLGELIRRVGCCWILLKVFSSFKSPYQNWVSDKQGYETSLEISTVANPCSSFVVGARQLLWWHK